MEKFLVKYIKHNFDNAGDFIKYCTKNRYTAISILSRKTFTVGDILKIFKEV